MSVIVLVDLGYGDSGKGTMVDYLVRLRNAKTVVRFNGGSQAAHNVVLPDGRHHTFAQFGSGTFAGAKTYLSRFHLFDPLALESEAKKLVNVHVDPRKLVTVDRQALVVTFVHVLANRLRELRRGTARHGSCGVGVWETQRFAEAHPDLAVTASDLERGRTGPLRYKVRMMQEKMFEELTNDGVRDAFIPESFRNTFNRYFDMLTSRFEVDRWCNVAMDAMRIVSVGGPEVLSKAFEQGDVIFEPAQGVLLDRYYGFHPFVTGSVCTLSNAFTLVYDHISAAEDIETVGVMRAYMTRHGPGPLVTECKPWTDIKDHNKHGAWQGDFRLGQPDLVAWKYALSCCGAAVDQLAVTCVDHVADHPAIQVCTEYELLSGDRIDSIPRHDHTPEDKWTDAMQQRQQLTTAALLSAKPVYEHVDMPDYLKYLGRALEVDVTLVSRGPTHEHKEIRPAAVTVGKETT